MLLSRRRVCYTPTPSFWSHASPFPGPAPRSVSLCFNSRYRNAHAVWRCAAAKPVAIRPARYDDIAVLSKLLASGFARDDIVATRIRNHFFMNLLGVENMLILYELLCRWEVQEQLKQRLGGLEQSPQAKHVVLVATNANDEQDIVGCMEMGVVNVPRLIEDGLESEVRQWQQNILSASPAHATDLSAMSPPISPTAAPHGAPYIGNVVVQEHWRRQGVGSLLLKRAAEVATEWGKNDLWLHVDEKNAGAKGFYRSLGFDCEIREPEFYEHIGRQRRMLLRGRVQCLTEPVEERDVKVNWSKAKVATVKLPWWQYVRYCWYDLSVRRRASE